MNTGIYGYLQQRGMLPLGMDLSALGRGEPGGGVAAPPPPAPLIPQGMAPLQAPVAPPSYAPGGFLRGVDRVLGGPPMAGLTPQNATEARRLGLLNAGIGMLAGASHGNFADALVGGLSGGQAGYQQGIQSGMGQQDAQAQQRMWADLQPRDNETPLETYKRLQKMLVTAAQSGNKWAISPIGQALDRAGMLLDKPAGASRPPETRIGPDGKEYTWEPADATHPTWWQKPTGRVRPSGSNTMTLVPPGYAMLKTAYDNAQQDLAAVDSKFKPTGEGPAAWASPEVKQAYQDKVTEWQAKRAVVARRMAEIQQRMDQAMQGIFGPGFLAPQDAGGSPGFGGFSADNPFAGSTP